MTSVLWLRRDLRRRDHPALAAASEEGPVLPLYVADPRTAATSPVRWKGLKGVLEELRGSYDGALVVRVGDPARVVPEVAREVRASAVHVTPDFTPGGVRADEQVAAALSGEPADTKTTSTGRGPTIPLVATDSAYAIAPGGVRTQVGTPYRVFTPFLRAWREHGWPPPQPDAAGVRFVRGVESQELPAGPETDAVPNAAGEASALARWASFLDDGLERYGTERDRPDLDGTSRLSAALRWGSVHPRTLLADLARHRGAGAEKFVAELAWREFYADVLAHRPASGWADLNPLPGLRYDREDDPEVAPRIEAWRQGRTGFPLVDAGMRQLLATGWMHNRVRMVVASFLVKDLHVWWPIGAAHFRTHLADYDLASNSQGWQWVAGTGTDAAPYFRVFNPVAQGLRFDPAGDYVRRWVPELRHLAGAWAHEPWRAADGYRCGYARPIVDHADERAEALARYEFSRRVAREGAS